MKYKAILETDDIKDFTFFENDHGKYIYGVDACACVEDDAWIPLYFKEVEQEPVLDKVRAEIESMDFDFGDYYDHTNEIIEMVCKVIDKYKAESEG